MRKLTRPLLVAFLGAGLAVCLTLPLLATLKYKKETEKKCAFCHSGIPKAGDEDPQLNEEGKKFKNNNYKLTEDQKSKPGTSRNH